MPFLLKSNRRDWPLKLVIKKGQSLLIITLQPSKMCNMLEKRNYSTSRSQSHHANCLVLCYVIKDFRGQRISDELEDKNNLKSHDISSDIKQKGLVPQIRVKRGQCLLNISFELKIFCDKF